MPEAPHPDAELVARCQKGDDGAWADLVASYGKKVYGIAWHMTYDRAEAEELTQDCFLKVWQNLDRYEPTEASLLAWIAALSRNLCIDHYRRRKREKGFFFLSDDAVSTLLPATDDPQADAVRRERVRMLLDAISELPDELAEVVILRDLDGLEYREIGELLKLADGTVKSRLNRARIELARVVRGRVGASTGDGRSLYSPFGPRTTTGHGRRAMSAACRAFEQRLAEALDRAGEGATAAAARDLAAADAHAAECPACALLATLVAGHAGVFAFLARPEPSPEFLSRLSETPADVRARQEASEVLSFLTPGALARPEPSLRSLKRLLAVPGPAPSGAVSNVRRGVFGRLRPLVTDWRFAVVAAYAATFLIVALLRLDPMSAARGAANDLTSAGERALSEARVAAVHRFDESALGRATAPITKRLDYRVYRAFAAGRARAIAYSQLVFEKVFGGAADVQQASHDTPEPSEPFQRS